MKRRAFVRDVAAGFAGALACAGAAHAWADGFGSLADELRAAADEPAFWSRVRKEFLLNPGLVHLNTGTLGATPRRVLAAVSQWMFEVEGDPVSNVFGPLGHRMEDVRTKAAKFLNAGLDEATVTENTTSGMNAVAQGLSGLLRPGDEILTTNHEHPGGAVCWEYLARQQGVKLVPIAMPAPVRDKAQILQLVRDHLSPRTRVCSFSHVETITGLRMPLAEIAEITRPREILLVCDGAQAPGMLKIDVKALGVDTYASSSHKWMLAPKGSGLLYISKEAQERIRPMLLSTGYQAYTAASGTRNVSQILGHGMAMDFHEAIGRDRIQARSLALATHLRRRFGEISNLTLITPADDELATGIVSFGIKTLKNDDVYKRLYTQHEIMTKVVAKPEYNALRFSTHLYNSEEEIDRTAAALSSILA